MLAEALRFERTQRASGELLQLEVPSECQPGLSHFLAAIYDLDVIVIWARSIGPELKLLCDTAHMLQARKMLAVCDAQLASPSARDLQAHTVAAEYTRAALHGMRQYQDRCAKYIASSLAEVAGRTISDNGRYAPADPVLQPLLKHIAQYYAAR